MDWTKEIKFEDLLKKECFPGNADGGYFLHFHKNPNNGIGPKQEWPCEWCGNSRKIVLTYTSSFAKGPVDHQGLRKGVAEEFKVTLYALLGSTTTSIYCSKKCAHEDPENENDVKDQAFLNRKREFNEQREVWLEENKQRLEDGSGRRRAAAEEKQATLQQQQVHANRAGKLRFCGCMGILGIIWYWLMVNVVLPPVQ